MEDDDEMADYGTDLSDDVRVESIVDPHFDAKARPQQGSTVEIRTLTPILCRRIAGGPVQAQAHVPSLGP